ncbi:cadherin-like beta sandwich domain-containing protein [Lederbergia sp. NSJ-179]|uniref:cadherin-like beta sandwich domain-containing protein n=1 Tax=Lederbergia sp. NSJ-179 TaxID=2931402 RepID=UPI001FD4399F|nr:cadherin-like beta sandwich domain-containing protein [Lederbergia sp. NSJ-179]MCJ7841640.1 cadherin-like beta sandwich domain-containing protein [Lederbergia sp. NSJ-179]
MELNKRMKIIAIGTIIGLANITPYPISPIRAEEVAQSEGPPQLASIKIDEFQLDQSFSPTTTTYTADVANHIKTITIQAEAEEASATVTINGKSIGNAKKTSLPIETGENIFTITVINEKEVNTYTITVNRAKNENNQLAKLTLSGGSIEFDPDLTSYHVKVENKISEITIQPEVAVDTSSVEIDGMNLVETEQVVEIPVGTTTINITVTAENGSKRTYKLTITRAKKQAEAQKSAANDPSEKTETKQKPDANNQPKTTETEKNSANNQSGMPKTEQKANASAISVKPTKAEANEQLPEQPTGAKTTQSNQTNLKAASLMSGNTMTTKEISTKANLQSLIVSEGTWNKSFTSDAYTYHIAVNKDVSKVTITANPEESDAKVVIKGNEPSNSAAVAIENQAKTVISVVITRENDRKTYVMVFDKDLD